MDEYYLIIDDEAHPIGKMSSGDVEILKAALTEFQETNEVEYPGDFYEFRNDNITAPQYAAEVRAEMDVDFRKIPWQIITEAKWPLSSRRTT